MDFKKITSDIDNYMIKGIPFDEDWFKYVQLVKVTLLMRELKNKIPETQRLTFLENFLEFAADKDKFTAQDFTDTFQRLRDDAATYGVELNTTRISSLAYTSNEWSKAYNMVVFGLENTISKLKAAVTLAEDKAVKYNKVDEQRAALQTELDIANAEITRLKQRIANLS